MKNLSKTLAISALSLALAANAAQAADFTKSATIELLNSTKVSEQTKMNFGTIGTSLTAQNVTLIADQNLINTGDGGVIDASDASLGVYNLSGFAPAGEYHILATAIGTSGTNIVFTEVTHKGNNIMGSGTSIIPTNGTATIELGGTLNIPANLPTGEYTPSFTLTVTNS